MVNAADLKSAAAKAACGFEPRPRHCEIVWKCAQDVDRRRLTLTRPVGLKWAASPHEPASESDQAREITDIVALLDA